MIKLTRLDGEPFVLNADLIRYVEALPDTFITILSGERIIVRESMDEVLEKALAYQQAKHLIPAPAVRAGSHLRQAIFRHAHAACPGHRSYKSCRTYRTYWTHRITRSTVLFRSPHAVPRFSTQRPQKS